MDKITVGVLTVSDRCCKNEAVDESGPNLVKMIREGVVKNCEIAKTFMVQDCKEDIEKILKDWCDVGIRLILTTGGTGIGERDVTPEATTSVVTKTVPGISSLIFKRSVEITSLAALSRGIAGIRKKSLIINLPGSYKASGECLRVVADVIPHAVDLIIDKRREIGRVHASLEVKKSSVVMENLVLRNRVFFPCISVSQAQEIVTKRIFLLRKEKVVEFKEALGYVLAKDVISRDYLPPFDASLKDGYAIVSSDCSEILKVVGVSQVGDLPLDIMVTSGCCVRISTGAYIPPGADAVVEVENTSVIHSSETEKEIALIKFPSKGQDIRPKGADFSMNERILRSGKYLDASAIGLLGAAGENSVKVFDKPLVAVISTGDELVDPDEELKPGKVRDSNRITLLCLLREENFQTVDLGIALDTPDALRNSLERGFQTADIVVTTGSMSMGERDYLKEVLVADFNAELCFGRIFMKPGKPTSFANLMFEGKPKLWFGLPGNPASAFVTFHLIVLPALRKISGLEETLPSVVKAIVNKSVSLEDRPQYVRGILTYDEEQNSFTATVLGNQRSSRIGSCVNANCLLEFPSINLGYKKEDCIDNEKVKVKALLIGKSYI